ncbi:hypothetical protein [Lepagella muris]|jgi:mRNA interferase YafQ|nr:hypothetical protein [Lepagella muris]
MKHKPKKLKPTTKYKKDYKRFRNNPKKVEKLFEILKIGVRIYR